MCGDGGSEFGLNSFSLSWFGLVGLLSFQFHLNSVRSKQFCAHNDKNTTTKTQDEKGSMVMVELKLESSTVGIHIKIKIGKSEHITLQHAHFWYFLLCLLLVHINKYGYLNSKLERVC